MQISSYQRLSGCKLLSPTQLPILIFENFYRPRIDERIKEFYLNSLATSFDYLTWGDGEDSNKRKKVIILGSGGLSIGQAGEFDYSGSQVLGFYF